MKLTFKQVYEKVGINGSTASFQRDKFAEFIPCEGEGRHRKYNEESIEVLQVISKMYAEGKTYEEIREVLESRFGTPAELVVQENNSSTTQLEAIGLIKDVFKGEISRLESKIDELTNGSENHDRLLTENIRLLQQLNRPWWMKIFHK